MAQILVMTDPSETDGEIVYSESVGTVHLEGQAGNQLVERLRWAVHDAQVAEHRAPARVAGAPDGWPAAAAPAAASTPGR
ncbi:MAG TPA: hypothetical protein VHE08_02330 [Solirubrobacterales bacterium]|nr:hypothetical protein [Solirubrobacterales bacterium]